jgi:hypothetical protein
LHAVTLRHCSLVPAKGGIAHTGTGTDLTLSLYRCLSGPLRSNRPLAAVVLRDSLIDGEGGNLALDVDDSPLTVIASTLLGTTAAGRLEASNSLFDGLVTSPAARKAASATATCRRNRPPRAAIAASPIWS